MNAIEKIVIKNVEVKVGDKVQVIFNRFPETEKNNVSVTGKVKGITEYNDKIYLGIEEHYAGNWFSIGICTDYIISIKKVKRILKMAKNVKIRKFECENCGDHLFFEMADEQYEQYINKVKHVEDIFPNMEIELRETLITGECTDCRNDFFEFDYIQVGDD